MQYKGPGLSLVQVAVAVAFMAFFHFPWPMIAVFSALLLTMGLVSSHLRSIPRDEWKARRERERNAVHPAWLHLINVCITICVAVIVITVIFGFPIFMDSWEGWHRMQTGTYRPAYFRVLQSYYQPYVHSANGRVYARGLVDGDKTEWMNLLPYLGIAPHNQAELDREVPRGTTMAVYYNPSLIGYDRVRLRGSALPPEAEHRTAILTMQYALIALLASAALIALLVRLRRFCL